MSQKDRNKKKKEITRDRKNRFKVCNLRRHHARVSDRAGGRGCRACNPVVCRVVTANDPLNTAVRLCQQIRAKTQTNSSPVTPINLFCLRRG